ncbi:MAG: hypothetical protein R3266_07985, partial [Gemmatimonadota bacterium]|nr:hypothetical protein [Gemmatimonadota bacterium]
LCDVYRATGRVDRAGALCREALELYRELEAETSPVELANALRSEALLLEVRGEVAEARSAWTEVRDLYARAGVGAGVEESEARLDALEEEG